MKCLNCEKETKNPKFCCKSCSAIYNNKIVHKRKPKIRYCKKCNKQLDIIRNGVTGNIIRKNLCTECNRNLLDYSKVTKKDLTSLRSYQINSRIRNIARNIYKKSELPKKCFICGYETYYEVCHKKAIKDFDDDTPLSDINNLDNLVALCPNHHLEFDNNLIDI